MNVEDKLKYIQDLALPYILKEQDINMFLKIR